MGPLLGLRRGIFSGPCVGLGNVSAAPAWAWARIFRGPGVGLDKVFWGARAFCGGGADCIRRRLRRCGRFGCRTASDDSAPARVTRYHVLGEWRYRACNVISTFLRTVFKWPE